MDMIKKIALTASTMLFVLAQAFSFYVIFTSRQEKIDLLKNREYKIFQNAVVNLNSKLYKAPGRMEAPDYVMVYFFRESMPENTALYKGEEELYNGSPYEFDTTNIDLKQTGSQEYPFNCKLEKTEGRYILVFWEDYSGRYYFDDRNNYILLYGVDITSIYQKSWDLVIQELLASFFASLGMALVLVFLIKKITKPLQAAIEAQRQLIGSLSHEMKTPLTAIKGYSETLLHVTLSPEQKEKSLNYIYQESGRLSRLSEKMMELTRLYEPECKVAMQEISVETLFEEVESSVKHRMEETGVHLAREGGCLDTNIILDADLMASFLINLINNSVTASKPGSTVYMGADGNSLWVRDEGCGIPPEEVDKVRKAFYRVDKSRSRKSGNMGLGLALCEQIAAVHHGRMEIESQVGEGTKVSIVLMG